ncbi:MAG TPA: hypothetical protein VF748_15470 [Candidatus Acidoferrum sp.]
MPHDANGNELKVGDKVNIPATVTMLTTGDEFCNCSVLLDFRMPPDNTENTFSVNTTQVLLSPIQEAAEAPPEEAPSGGSD